MPESTTDARHRPHAARTIQTFSLAIGMGLAVTVAATAWLWQHAAPGVTFHDSGEFALAAASAGIAHPPGAPTWVAPASAFVRLGGFADAARGTNLFSGLCGGLTLGLASALVTIWMALLWPGISRRARAIGGVSAALVLLHAPAFLEQSLTTEQYTLMTVFIGATLLVATLLVHVARHGGDVLPPAVLLGLLWGLAIGNHPTQVVLGVTVGWACLAAAWPAFKARSGRGEAGPPRAGGWWKPPLVAVAGLAVGLLVFLWLPLRSHADPIMDWGNVETLDRFIWAMTRRQWGSRALSDAPAGFVLEWIETYEFIGHLGVVGCALALFGIYVLLKLQKTWLGWLFAASVPYAAVLLIGHMRQAGINLTYIQQYGVQDWHLPLYQAGAILAGMGAGCLAGAWEPDPDPETDDAEARGSAPAREVTGPPGCLGWAVVVLMMTYMGFAAARSTVEHSLREWHAPERYLSALLTGLPDDAIVLTSIDSTANMLAYATHAQAARGGEPPGRWVAYDTKQLPRAVAAAAAQGGWNAERRVAFLTGEAADPNFQPLRLDALTTQSARNRPLYAEYRAEHPEAASYMLPRGLLFEVLDRPATDEQVRAAEAATRERFPELFAYPGARAHRLEREAWATIHGLRGSYFIQRGMWREADAELARSVAWIPDNALVWFYRGVAIQHLGPPYDAAQAYTWAMEHDPQLVGPRGNLAVMHAQAGMLHEAEELLLEELMLDPGNAAARRNLDLIRGQLAGEVQGGG